MSSTLPVTPLLAGACFTVDTDVGIKCAYQPSDCEQSAFGISEVFVSPLWLAQNDPQWATRCGSQLEVRFIPGLGRCQSELEDYLCTSDRSACIQPRSFERPVNDCNLLQDKFAGTSYGVPQFGRCAHSRNPTRDFCAWSKVDCDSPEGATANTEFTFQVADPSMGHVSHDNCGCHSVHVGACVSEEVWYCAVSEEVCQAEKGFRHYPVLEFQAFSNTSCRLCDATNVDLPAPSPSPVVVPKPASPPVASLVITQKPVANNPAPNFSAQKVPVTEPESISAKANDQTKNDGGIVVEYFVGGLAAAAVFVLAVLLGVKGTSSARRTNTSHTIDNIVDEETPGEIQAMESIIAEAGIATANDIQVEDMPELT
mmetsp:Transcript_28722/g.61641  ORF Transcript_28722/g.61641 Transcript_28722/m.61641 type:complete len:370 (-) Transcript_28722:28-1137(-)|eukprot:CAMPEP_0201227534 /NCGR_PEP_ID=MMETSP0851-20130426/195172_1 /ASSEMBLY_ACC=CAM_ASM_000631 /TAXON_ID=183588 /ORGANISM="Pseudo-nitzschia fraudulenta, Strain WWA7" /LENGTH=369 /DNA_ID=CAMNT_0047517321 /DNA_START=1405 /DNA_END=2514 /DNA_ORIENTATION=+